MFTITCGCDKPSPVSRCPFPKSSSAKIPDENAELQHRNRTVLNIEIFIHHTVVDTKEARNNITNMWNINLTKSSFTNITDVAHFRNSFIYFVLLLVKSGAKIHAEICSHCWLLKYQQKSHGATFCVHPVYCDHPRSGVVYNSGRVCLSVCQTITFESIDVESLYLHIHYISRKYESNSYIKVIGSRSRSQE